MTLYEQQRRNREMTWWLVTAFTLLLIVVGAGVDFFVTAPLLRDINASLQSAPASPWYLHTGAPIATLLALSGSAMMVGMSFLSGEGMVLGSVLAEPVDTTNPHHVQWRNVIEEMAIAAGVPTPRIFVIPDDDLNALAVGLSPQRAAIAATRGLLERLNREELQAVAAHEMSHIRNEDTRVMTLIATLVGAIALLAQWTRRLLWSRAGRGAAGRSEGAIAKSGASRRAAPALFLLWLCVALFAPLAAQLMALCVSRQREYLADATGVELTRNPLALARALGTIAQAKAPTQYVNRGTAHLCIHDPRGERLWGAREGGVADWLSTHPPIEKRIGVLCAMAHARPEEVLARTAWERVPYRASAPDGWIAESTSSEQRHGVTVQTARWHAPRAGAGEEAVLSVSWLEIPPDCDTLRADLFAFSPAWIVLQRRTRSVGGVEAQECMAQEGTTHSRRTEFGGEGFRFAVELRASSPQHFQRCLPAVEQCLTSFTITGIG